MKEELTFDSILKVTKKMSKPIKRQRLYTERGDDF